MTDNFDNNRVVKLKEYCVCEEIIHNQPSRCYTVRVNTDISPARFVVKKDFDTFAEADNFRKILVQNTNMRR